MKEWVEDKRDSISLDDVVQIVPQGYRLVTLDTELQGEFPDAAQGIKIDAVEINEIPRTQEDGLVLSKFISQLENDTISPSFCRLCATRSDDMVSIFGKNRSAYSNIVEKIGRCLAVVVRKTDTLPKQVCHLCLDKLEYCYRFHKTVAEAEKQLFILGGQEFATKDDNIVGKLRRLSDRDTNSNINNKSTTVSAELKITDSNLSNLIFESKELSPNNTRGTTNLNEEDIPGSLRTENENANSIKIETIEELRSEDRIFASKKRSPSLSKSNKLENILRVNFEKENEADNIMFVKEGVADEAFCKLIRCRICGDVFQTVKKCHIHSSVHATSHYYPCCICDKIFINEKDCNEHSTEHAEGKKFERRPATHVCDECGKKFITEDRLQFHKVYHDSEVDSCYCKKCDKLMASESSLYQHMLTVHRQYKEYCCDICGKQFRAQAQLGAHQRKHKDERPFECTICKKRFFSNDILRRHKKLHLPDKPYQCDQCGKRFDRNNTLTKHLLRHQVEAGQSMICHVCKICREVFLDASAARLHLRDCNGTTNQENDDSEIVVLDLKEMYRCEFCEKCYTHVDYMKNHRSCHSEPSPYVCTVCDTAYTTYNQMTAHKTAHKKSSKVTNAKVELLIPKYFACEQCDKHFLHFTNMNIHRRTCSSGKIWTCRCCGALFENVRELSRHKKGENDDKKWLCNVCNTSFGSVCTLEMHKETHSLSITENKKFSCLHCGKTFSQKAHLTIHVRSHTGERPYSCDLCDKTYKIKTERDNHQRTHSGEKPFKCTICEKTFANAARLREHTRFHSGKRPYNCSHCNQSFKKANARNVHMTIHTGEKPYQCDVCGTYFRRTGDMRKHKRIQHGETLTSFKMDYEIQ